MQIENNENREACARCKDRCCEFMGCEIFPEDLINRFGQVDVASVEKLMMSGKVMIDVYEFDDDTYLYLLRMRTVDDHFVVDQGHWAKCICLGDNGCTLDWDDRPTGAKIVVPNPDNPGEGCTCVLDVEGKITFAEMWRPYQDVLKYCVEKYASTPYSKIMTKEEK